MRTIILIIITFINLNSFSQSRSYIYVDSDNDFVVFLDKNLTTFSQDVDNTTVDVFVKTTDEHFNYTLLISKANDPNFKSGNILDEAYENEFLNGCNCDILESEIVYYNNIITLRFKIKAINNENVFIGYNDSFVSNGILYSIMFLTFEDNFEKEYLKYRNIMNTFIFNGITTIDGYNDY
jgi:hypothetical protein